MKLRKILYGLTLMLGCFVLASCVNEEEGPCLPEGKTKVLFKLTLPENAQTRAEAIRVNWGTGDLSNFEQGGDKDNYIDLSSIKMLIFDADNRLRVGDIICMDILSAQQHFKNRSGAIQAITIGSNLSPVAFDYYIFSSGCGICPCRGHPIIIW